MAKMTVYHGGYISVENPQVRIGRNTKDFGTGFYCTVIKEQAQRWAKRYDTKVVSIYEVRLNLDLNKRCIALALGCVVLVEGCWYKSKGEYQHGRKNCTYIERDVRVSVDCTDEKITGSCVKNIFGK